MRTIPVLLFTSLLLGACDCGWNEECDDTAESLDTTVVTATMSGREVTLTARDPGETHVYISSALMGNPNTGTFDHSRTV